jgi:hypothetical protein
MEDLSTNFTYNEKINPFLLYLLYTRKMDVDQELKKLNDKLHVYKHAINNYIQRIKENFNNIPSGIKTNIENIIHSNPNIKTLDTVIEFILNNIVNIYPVINTDIKTQKYFPMKYYLSTEKDTLGVIRPTYIFPQILDIICKNSSDVKLCGDNELRNIILKLQKYGVIIFHDNFDYKNSSKFSINDLNNSFKRLEEGYEITTQVEYSVIISHMRSICDSVFTDLCNCDEKFIYHLINIHHNFTNTVLNELKSNYYDIDGYKPFLLKGGNVLKLKQRELLQNSNEILSDFDFGISIPKSLFNTNDMKVMRESFFMHNTLQTDRITEVIDRTYISLYIFISDLWNIMYSELTELVNDNILITKGNEICTYLTNNIQDIHFDTKNVYHTRVFNSNDAKYRRSISLFENLDVEKFKILLNGIPTNIINNESSNLDSSVRVVDVEVFSKTMYKNYKWINGFDVLRLSLNFRMILNFDKINLKYNTKSELLDYSLQKIYTIGHILPTYDYITAVFRPNGNLQDETKIDSYSLNYFIDDVIRMCVEQPRQIKHDKRINRVLIALMILHNSIFPNELYDYLINRSLIGYNVKNYIIIGRLMLDNMNKLCDGKSTSNCIERSNIGKILSIYQNFDIKINDLLINTTNFPLLNEIKIDINLINEIIQEYNNNHPENNITGFTGGSILTKPIVKQLICISFAFFIIVMLIIIMFYNDFLIIPTRNFSPSFTNPISSVVNIADSNASILSDI